MNRKVFWFNDKLDVHVLEPAARGWVYITPHFLRRGISNVFDNLEFPVIFVNDLLQGKVRASASATGRFAVNSTVGILGFFDPASGCGLERQIEDSGQTFGKWGIPPGPYLVLPIWGPSDPRDAVGLVADGALLIYPFFAIRYITVGTGVLQILNLRAEAIDDICNAKEAALDYYTLVRNAYIQRRHGLVHDDARMTPDEQEDLYEFDLLDE